MQKNRVWFPALTCYFKIICNSNFQGTQGPILTCVERFLEIWSLNVISWLRVPLWEGNPQGGEKTISFTIKFAFEANNILPAHLSP